MQFSVQSIPMSTRLRGFTSVVKAHAHLFKHVIPLGPHYPIHKGECWEEIVGDPPLVPDVARRVEAAAARLANTAGCALGESDEAPCYDCRDTNARWEIDLAFAPQLKAYLAVAQEALDWAFSNPTRAGKPRAMATCTDKGWRLETVETRGVRLVAGLPETGGELTVITCYRDLKFVCEDRRKKRYERMWLDLTRQMAGSRHNGTALELVLGGGS